MAKKRKVKQSNITFDTAAGNEKLGVIGKASNRAVEGLAGVMGEPGLARVIRHGRKAAKKGFDPARAGRRLKVKEMPRRGKKRK